MLISILKPHNPTAKNIGTTATSTATAIPTAPILNILSTAALAAPPAIAVDPLAVPVATAVVEAVELVGVMTRVACGESEVAAAGGE